MSKPSKATTLEAADATYAINQQDLDHNLNVILDRTYGASGPGKDGRKFIPGLDGLAGDRKWRPHIEFTAAPGGSRTMGQINLFAPLAQDSDSLLFVDLRTSAWTNDVQEGNFGLGYRQIVPGGFFGTDAIFGVYGFVDARRSAYDNMFYQGTLGAELITENFEFRANAYLPGDKQYTVGTVGSGVTLNGRNFVYSGNNLVERALPGFDVEAGIKLDFSEAAIRLNAGYFRFERGNTLVEGPRFRAEVEIDDPFGLNGAKLSFGGEIRTDKVRGTEASGIVRLRMPIGGSSETVEAERQLSGLDRLMTRRVYRDDDIVTPVVAGNNVNAGAAVTDAISGESLQAFYVANSAQGAADCTSVANACDFVTAQGLAGVGDTFLPVDVAGAIGSVFTLNNNRQQVIGAGDTGSATVVLSDSASSVVVLTSLGGRPIVTGINIGHFADTRIAGLITNSATGITGDGMTGTIAISDVQTNNGGLNFANSAATIAVSDTALDSGAATGIALANLTGTASFANVDLTSAGGTGLSIDGGSVNAAFDADSSLTQSGAGATVEVLNSHTGTLTSEATISAASGTGLQFNNADGTYNFNGVSNLNGGDAGIDILGGSAGTFSFGANTAILSPTGMAFNVDGSAATVNYNGTITQNNAAVAVSVTNNTGGTITFAGLVTANTSTATGVDLVDNTGADIAFTGGLNIDTTTGTGLSATGGGTVSVSATAGDESIMSTGGQALDLDGVSIGAGGIGFDSISSTGSATTGITIDGVSGGAFMVSGATTVSGSTGNAIQLTGNSSVIGFNGATTITMTNFAAGVDFSGTTSGAVSFADLDIALQTGNTTGVDFSGAILNADVTATDFDLTSASLAATTGINLSGTTGTGTIQLGDTDAAGQSATFAGVNVGVQFDAATNATFIFGDGEAATDTGSSISGTTAIAGGSAVTLGSYDFDDVGVFTGTLDFTAGGGAGLVFVAATATGDGSGSDVDNRANVITADAIAATGTTFVLINDGAAIDDADGFSLTDGQTMASFGNGRTFATSGLAIPANFSGVPGAGVTVTDPTGNGAAILTRTGGAGDTLTASGTVNLQDFVIENAAAGAGLSATGATGITSTGLTVQNVAGQGIDLNSLTGAASTFDNTRVSTTTGNGVDIVNSDVNFTGGLDITTTTGTGFSATGGGTINVAAGAASNTVAATAGQIINIDGISGALDFTTLTSTNAPLDAISMANFAAGSSFTVSGATTITTPAGDGLHFSNVGGTVTFGGTVTVTTPNDDGFDIRDSSNGTISFQNVVTVTDAGDSGVVINGFDTGPAATGTITFGGLLDIDRSGFAGLNIFDRVGAISFANVDIDTAGVGGVLLVGTQLDGALTFGQLDINGGPGSQVGLGIANGTAGTIDINGGTIENIDGEGIGLIGANVNLTYSGTLTQAIAGAELVLVDNGDASNVTFEAGSVLQATGGDGLRFNNADGTYTFAGTTTLNGGDAGIDILNDSAGTFAFGANTAITSPTGTAFNLDASQATVNYSGVVTQLNAASAVAVTNNTGGAVTFAGLVTANTATATGINLAGNAGAVVAFTGGLNIDTTTGTGFSATGGGTVSVAASAGDESISATAGQALNLAGITIGTGGVAFDSISSTGSGSTGIEVNGISGGAFLVSGTTSIAGATGDGIALTGNSSVLSFGITNVAHGGGSNTVGIDLEGANGEVSFGVTTLTGIGTATGQKGIDFNSATLGGKVSFESVAISGSATSTDSIGVDLTGVLGNQIVNLGSQIDPATGPSSSITDLHRGVVIGSTAAVQFSFGDGENGSDTGSSINVNSQAGAFTVDAGGGTLAASSFDFNDVMFGAGDTANFPLAASTPVFVSLAGGLVSAGTNNLSQNLTTITVAAAEAAADTDQTFVFVGDGTGTLDLQGGGIDGFTLDAGQNIDSFNDGNVISLGVVKPLNIEGMFNIAGVTSDNVTAVNTAIGATSVIATAAGGNHTIANVDISTSATGVLINGGSAAVTVSNVGVTGIAGAGTGLSIQGASAAIALNNVDIFGVATGIDNQLGTASGDVTVDAASSIANTTTIAVNLGQNASDFAFSGTISETDATGAGIAINQLGGEAIFSGMVALDTGASNAVSLTANTGSVGFTGGLDVTTSGGIGLNATGGGTVGVANSGAEQIVATGTGTAINFDGITVAAGGINFDQVTTAATATANGVDINDTAGGTITLTNVSLGGSAVTSGLDISGNARTSNVVVTGGTIGNGAAISGNGSGMVAIGASIAGTADYAVKVTNRGAGAGQVDFNGAVAGSTGAVSIQFNTAGTVNFNATVTGTGTNNAGAININNNTGGAVTFAGLVDIDVTGAGTGVAIANSNAGSIFNFNAGLNIHSVSGVGFEALSGTVSVAASAGDESITTTAGQALNLNGVTIGAGGMTFDSVSSTGSGSTGIDINGVSGGAFTVSGATTISGSTGNAIQLTGNSAALNFNGATSVTMSSAAVGVDFAGTTSGAVSFANLDIALQSANAIGFDLSGAVINANVTATDFDLTSTSTAGTTGVNLSGTTGTGTIQLGDSNVAGASATIAGVNVGVQFDAATNATFIFGDGEAATDTGSSISGTTAIAGGSAVTLGSYDFDDVGVFTGTLDFTAGGGAGLVFVAATATGDGSGSDVDNRANVITADAIAATGTTFVLINDGAAIDDADGFSLTDGQTMASFGNGRTFATSGLAIPANFSGVPGAGVTVTDPTGNGAAILTRTGGAGDTLTASGTVNLQDFVIENAAAGAGLSATGATGITSTGLTVQNVAGQGIDLNSLTGAASSFDNTMVSTTGNGVDIVNSDVNFTGGLDITTTTGTGFNATGGGTVSVAATAGTEQIVATGTGTAINFDGITVGAGGINFDQATTAATSTGTGVDINDATGGAITLANVSLAGTAVTSGLDVSGNARTSNVVVTSGTIANGVALSGNGSGTVTIGASISDTAGYAVQIANRGAGAGQVDINGAVTSGTGAVSIQTNSAGIVNFGGTVTGTGANTSGAINIDATTGGTVTFAGLVDIDVSGAGTGVSIANSNAGGIFNFTGGLDINSVDGTGFEALSGTISVAATAGVESITVGNAAALVLNSVTANLTFDEINATNTAKASIDIDNSDGTFALNGGTFNTVVTGTDFSTIDIDQNDAGATRALNVAISGVTINHDASPTTGGDEFGINSLTQGDDSLVISIANSNFKTEDQGVMVTSTNAMTTVTDFSNNTLFGDATAFNPAFFQNGVQFVGVVFDSDLGTAGLQEVSGGAFVAGSLAERVSNGASFSDNIPGVGAVAVSNQGTLRFSSYNVFASNLGLYSAGNQATATLATDGGNIDALNVTFGSVGASVDLDVTLDSLTLSGGLVGLQFGTVSGSFSVTGSSSIAVGASQTGIYLLGATGATISFADLDIALTGNNATGIDFSNATINANFTANDFDITSTSATGTIGIDLAGATGTGTIQLGDTNTNGGANVTIGTAANMLAVGVQVDGATDLAFVLGDGDGTTGDLVASDIHATTAVNGTLPANGSYNFRDIDFNASGVANISGGASFFVFDEEGTSGAGTFADPGTAAQAAAASVDVLVAIDNSAVLGSSVDLSSVGQGAINTLTLDDNQALIGLVSGQSIDATTLGLGLSAGAPASFLFTGIGGTTTITGSGLAGGGLATIITTGANNTVALTGTSAIQSVIIANGGTGDGINGSLGAAENVVIRSSTIGGGTGGDGIDIATTAGASTFDFSNLTMSSGLRLDGTAGGTLTGTATGTNTIASAAGAGLYLDTVAIGAAGVTFDSVSSTNAGDGNSGILLDTLSGAGFVAITSATVVDSGGFSGGHAIDLTNIGMTGALDIANIDIDLPTTGGNNLRGILSNGGHTSTINLGTGAGGVAIDSAAIGIQFNGSAGVINIGTGAGSGGIQLNTQGGGIHIGDDSTGTIAIGTTATTSVIDAGNAFASSPAIAYNQSDATVTITRIDINGTGTGASGHGIHLLDNDAVGSFTLTGTNTIDNTGGSAIVIDDTIASISNVTIGGSATGAGNDITGAGIRIEGTDAISRTVALSNITMGSGGVGDTGDVAGIGLDINSSGAGILTVNLTGTNEIRSTGQALDVDETGAGTANNLLLSIDNTTFESGSAGQTVEITGQNVTTQTSSIGIRSFSGNTVTGNGTAGGITFTAVDFDSDGFDSAVAGGALNIGQSAGTRVSGKGLSFIDPTGDLGFTTLTIFNDGNTGLEVDTKTNGFNTVFNLTNSGGSVDTTNGTALFLDPLTMNLAFGTVTATGGTNGVFIDAGDASGGAGANALTITTLNVTGSTGAGLRINNSTGTFSFGTTTINNAATTGGGVDIDATGTDTTNVNFSNGLDIDTDSGAGFHANVFAPSTFNLEIANAGTETINTVTGQILNMLNVNGAGTGINFDSLTSTGTFGGDAVELDLDSGTFNGGAVTIAGATFDGISLAGSGGTINFASATIDNAGVFAIRTIFEGTATFTTVNIDGGNHGVHANGDGTLNIIGGTIGATTGTTGIAVSVTSGSGDVSIGASITNSSGNVLRALAARTGTVTLSGAINDTGSGIVISNQTGSTFNFTNASKVFSTGANDAITLTSNTGATINFTGGGLDIDTTTGTGFTATGGGTVTVTGAGNSIASTGGAAVSMDGVTIGAGGATFASIASGGGTNGISLQHVDGAFAVTGTAALNNSTSAGLNLLNSDGGNDGNLTFTANTLNISNASGGGAFVQRGTGSGRTDFDVTTGTISSGSRTPIFIANSGAATIDLGATFASVSMNGNANGIYIQNSLATGTISGALDTGTGGTIQNTGANAVNMNRLSANITIGSAITTASGGIRVTNQVSGTNTFSGVHTLTDAGSGYLFDSNAGGSTTISGNVAASTLNGSALSVNSSAAHTVTFSGTNTALSTTSGNTVDISGGATVNFNSTGTNTITATTGKGVEANGGGTVVIGGTASVSTTTGTAVDIQNTTIGASGVTFTSVSANGAVNGIVLNTTGTTGGFTVTGTGTTVGSGGTIQNTTGNAIQITDASDIDLRNMNLTNVASSNGFGSAVFGGNIANYVAAIKLSGVTALSLNNLDINGGETGGVNDNLGQVGISGQTVSGLTITDTTVQNFGNASGEDNIQFQGLTGTVDITNLISRDSGGDLFAVDNTGAGGTVAGGNLTMTVTGSTFDETVNGVGAGGLRLSVNGAGTTNVSVNTSQFGNGIAALSNNGLQGTGLQLNVGRGHVGTLTVEDSTFTGMNVAISGTLDTAGVGVGPELTVNIRDGADAGTVGNTIHTVRAYGINLFTNGGLATNDGRLNATITNNVIGLENVANSGSQFGSGIRVDNEGGSTVNVLIDNNTVQGVGDGAFSGFEGIQISNGVTASTTNATITNNLIRDIFDDRGLQIESTVAGGVVCSNVTGNTFSGDIRGDTPLNATTSVMRVRQTAGTHNVTQASAANLATENGLAVNNVTETGAITYSQPACVLP